MTDTRPPARPPHSWRWMTRRYVMALTLVAVLTSAGFAAFQALSAAHETTLAVVNMAGRQRMLSQRIALFVQRLADDQCPAPRTLCDVALADAVDQFEQTHKALLRGSAALGIPGPTSDAVEALYHQGQPSLDHRIEAFVAAARHVLRTPPGDISPDLPAVRHVLHEGPGPLLAALDQVVLQYQLDGEDQLFRLRLLETVLLLSTLIVLVLEGQLIFHPMVRRIQAQVEDIARISESLRAANESLERRVAERTAELEVAKAEAERANRSKGRFLSAAGHDMLQPLQAGEMFAGMLRSEVADGRGRALLDDLRRTQTSLRHLVRSVLDVSRLDAGTITPDLGPVAVQEILETVAAECGPAALDKDLRLNVVATSAWVISDRHLLERILRNLVGNALRYTDAGGVVLGARRRGEHVVIVVADSGTGIDDADQQRIFEEFVQVGPGVHDRSEGLGLGLAIVDRLCRLLGHRVELRSRPGHGSVFGIVCPAAPPKA